MSQPVSRLGRGLSTLIGPREPRPLQTPPPTPAGTGAASGSQEVRSLPVGEIHPNPKQPRQHFAEAALEELAASIRTSGVLQPILVRPAGEARYEIVAGERRWRAAQRAGLATVPAIVRAFTEAAALEVALIENLQREDLTALDRAAAYEQYIATFSSSADQLAARLGESRANVTNYLRLLKLSPEIRDLLARGELGMGQARAIAGVTDAARQLSIARLAVRRNLSVRQVEALAKSDVPTEPPASAPTGKTRHMQGVETALSKALGLRVKLVAGKRKNSGRVVIHYESLEEFDRLSERFGAGQHID